MGQLRSCLSGCTCNVPSLTFGRWGCSNLRYLSNLISRYLLSAGIYDKQFCSVRSGFLAGWPQLRHS